MYMTEADEELREDAVIKAMDLIRDVSGLPDLDGNDLMWDLAFRILKTIVAGVEDMDLDEDGNIPRLKMALDMTGAEAGVRNILLERMPEHADAIRLIPDDALVAPDDDVQELIWRTGPRSILMEEAFQWASTPQGFQFWWEIKCEYKEAEEEE